MFELYEPFKRLFVNREEHKKWMAEALENCGKETVVLHIRGIGGIGKSSLLEHWLSSVESSIILDCSRIDNFYDRLDTLAKGASRLGIELKRFTLLWHIRQRFVKGVEPGQEEGPGWVIEVIAGIPGLGNAVSFGKSIKVLGEKLKKAISRKITDLGQWLQTRLGEDYTERLLHILWKEPNHAQFLYLDALLEDLNCRETVEEPTLVMLDGFEVVDCENCLWQYSGRMISEAELWCVFLTSLKNTVGIIASRQSLPKSIRKKRTVEEAELLELNETGCVELLEKRGITEQELQSKIISVSGGNPFVISCVCDIHSSGGLSMEDVKDLSGDTLEEVRVKTWQRLFRRSEHLVDLIDRATLVPYLNQDVLNIIAPSMKTAYWNQLTRLSFIRMQNDGSWIIHDLAKELVFVELGQKLEALAKEVSDLLEKAATKKSNYGLMGLALSVRALTKEAETMVSMRNTVEELYSNGQHQEAISLLANTRFSTAEGMALLHELKGRAYYRVDRVVNAEHEFQEALKIRRELIAASEKADEHIEGAANILAWLGALFRKIDRPSESETSYWESIALYRTLTKRKPAVYLKDIAQIQCALALLLLSRHRVEEAEDAVQEALEIYGKLAASSHDTEAILKGTAFTIIISGRMMSLQDRLSEAASAFEEALRLYRELAKTNPDDYLKHVGHTLHRLAYILFREHDVSRTKSALQEELDIFNRLTKDSPSSHRKNRARVLGSIGYMLFCTGALPEAETNLRESVNLFKELAEDAPRAYSDSLASRLNDLGRLLRETGRIEEAEAIFLEALSLFEELAEDAPEVYSFGECASCQIGITQQELGRLYLSTNRLSMAEDVYIQALKTSKQIQKNIPHHRHEFLVGRILHDYAILLKHSKEFSKAEESIQEALTIYQKLDDRAPGVYTHVIASVLNNQAILLKNLENTSKAELVFHTALEEFKHLAEKAPKLFRHHYATTLHNYGITLAQSGRLDDAEVELLKALDIRKQIATKAPIPHLRDVAKSLSSLGIVSEMKGNRSEAQKRQHEALAIWEAESQEDNEVHKEMQLYTLSDSKLEQYEDELWFTEIFYHWSDCPFCI